MSTEMSLLTEANYKSGFLVRDHFLAGVAEANPDTGCFLSFILNSESGSYLGAHEYSSLQAALAATNRVAEGWKFESTSDCAGGDCGPEGSCAKTCESQ